MTPAHLRHTLAALHWTQRGLADILGMDERQVRRWAAGQYPVPADIAEWLERRARSMEADPPPTRRAA